jgi:N-hydroxyarylamine O-acetyltransferase
MDLSAYFRRVDYTGDAKPTAETLVALHRGHTYNIPFENLDVYAGKTISLAPDALFDKLVTRRRGGYCFEMNGLFTLALRELGFQPRQILARTAFGGFYSALLHEVIVVSARGRAYLCDVGYGNEGISEPVPMPSGVDADTRDGSDHRVTEDRERGYILWRRENGELVPMYAFMNCEYAPDDFEVANHYTSTHPNSFFKQQRFVTKPTPNGRITLTEQHLKITDKTGVTEHKVTSAGEFSQLLKKYFSCIAGADVIV